METHNAKTSHLKDYLEEIKETLINPDKLSKKSFQKVQYYKQYKKLKKPNKFTKMKNTYEIYYDEEGDFLELSFGHPAQEGTTEEIEEGIFITYDTKNNKLKDIGILDFKKRTEVLGKILKRFHISLPLNIN